jgi:hypothetical protein
MADNLKYQDDYAGVVIDLMKSVFTMLDDVFKVIENTVMARSRSDKHKDVYKNLAKITTGDDRKATGYSKGFADDSDQMFRDKLNYSALVIQTVLYEVFSISLSCIQGKWAGNSPKLSMLPAQGCITLDANKFQMTEFAKWEKIDTPTKAGLETLYVLKGLAQTISFGASVGSDVDDWVTTIRTYKQQNNDKDAAWANEPL